jgi:hypothetical protein
MTINNMSLPHTNGHAPGGDASTPHADDLDLLKKIRQSVNYAELAGTKKLLVRIPVRRPSRQAWIRTHPSEDYRIAARILELEGDDRETYLVLLPELPADVEAAVRPAVLYTAIDRHGNLFVWPVKLPGDGKDNNWLTSARQAAERASHDWVKVVSNRAAGAYDVFLPEASIPAPTWPDVPFVQLLRIAFRDRVIETVDHPVLVELAGR